LFADFVATMAESYQVAMTPTLGGFQVPVISIRCPDMRIG
jgi:hypothetical protein